MKFFIEKNELYSALQVLGKVVPLRTTLPSLGCVFFDCRSKILNLRATDLEVSIEVSIESVEIQEKGRVCVPFSKLNEIIGVMPNEKICFSLTDTGKIGIGSTFGSYTIMGQKADEFPSRFNLENTKTITLQSKDLNKIINNTTYAISKDEMKPALQGVLFEIEKNNITAVATDGHRLVCYKKNIKEGIGFTGSVVVPKKFLNIILNQYDKGEKTDIVFSENHVRVSRKNITTTSRIIKEKYPEYKKVLPPDNNLEVIIERDSLAESIKRVSVFSNKSTKQVSTEFDKNGITISTEDPENITTGKESLECNYEGEKLLIGYNANYLYEVLKHQEGEEIKILLKTPLTASIFMPLEQKPGESIKTLLMPIRIND
tara:strand:+ start:1457 stop:2575 length:1119 start_codon:yes stop_codon:yes gene_type:complete